MNNLGLFIMGKSYADEILSNEKLEEIKEDIKKAGARSITNAVIFWFIAMIVLAICFFVKYESNADIPYIIAVGFIAITGLTFYAIDVVKKSSKLMLESIDQVIRNQSVLDK